MNLLDFDFIKSFCRLCQDGWEQGWHERNGGNLTYRLTENEKAQVLSLINNHSPLIALGVEVQNLSNEIFLASGSGKYFRNFLENPEDNICLAHVNEAGTAYRVIWGLKRGGKPTSEFSSHLMNHSVKKKESNNACRIIYHAHPTNIIAMTYILPLTAKAFTRALWQSATECPVVFPDGVGIVPWMVPGGADIAKATSKLMENFDAVVWAHHGLFVSGSDFDTAF